VVDVKNTIGDGVMESSGAKLSGQSPVFRAPALPRRPPPKIPCFSGGVKDDRSANPTSPLVLNELERIRADGKPRVECRQRLYDEIAADERFRSSVVTQGPVAGSLPMTTTCEIRPRDARGSSDVETAKNDGGRDVTFDVGPHVFEKTSSCSGLVDHTWSLRTDYRDLGEVYEALRKNEEQRLNDLFAWIAKPPGPVKQNSSQRDDPPVCVATNSGRREAINGGSGCTGTVTDETPTWITDFDVDELEKIYNLGLLKRTVDDEQTVVHRITSAEETRSSDLSVDEIESKPSGCVVHAEDIQSVVGPRDSTGTLSCATESVDEYCNDLTMDDGGFEGPTEVEDTQRSSSAFERVTTAKRPNPVPDETEPLLVIVKYGWIDPPKTVLFRNRIYGERF
jgi:hypothetical protein